MDTTLYHVTLTFRHPILGAQAQKDVVTTWVNPQLPEDEAMALPEKLEKATTAFHRWNGEPCLFDYQVVGFLKEAAGVINALGTFKTKALKSKVEKTVFVQERHIPLIYPEGSEIFFLERPLRAQTAQGPRIALARSEALVEGTMIRFTIEILHGSQITKDILTEILDYGRFIGLGQWRTARWGSFDFAFDN